MTPDAFRDDPDIDRGQHDADRFEEWRAQASEDELADYYEGQRWRRG